MKSIMKIFLAFAILLFAVSVVSAEYQNPIENTTLEKFKESCTEVSYNDLSANDNLVGQPVKLHGTIYVSDSDSMLFNVDGDSNQQVYVTYKTDDESKVKDCEGKDATIYCLYQGKFDVPLMSEQLGLSLADIE